MRSKHNFQYERRVAGGGRERASNILGPPGLEGLELHRGVLNIPKQRLLVAVVEGWAKASRQVRGPLLQVSAQWGTAC